MPIQLTDTHECAWCDKPFTPRSPGAGRKQVYCSDSCRNADYQDRASRKLKPTEKHCSACGLVHAGDECP